MPKATSLGRLTFGSILLSQCGAYSAAGVTSCVERIFSICSVVHGYRRVDVHMAAHLHDQRPRFCAVVLLIRPITSPLAEPGEPLMATSDQWSHLQRLRKCQRLQDVALHLVLSDRISAAGHLCEKRVS